MNRSCMDKQPRPSQDTGPEAGSRCAFGWVGGDWGETGAEKGGEHHRCLSKMFSQGALAVTVWLSVAGFSYLSLVMKTSDWGPALLHYGHFTRLSGGSP